MLLSSKLTGRVGKWIVLAAWIAIIMLAVPLAGKLSGATKKDSPAEGPRGAQSTRVAELQDRFPDGKIKPGIVIYVRDAGITVADRAKVEADRKAFAPLAAGQIPPPVASKDGKALMLQVPIGDDGTADKAKQVRDGAARGLPAGLHAQLAGPAANALDASDAFKKIDSTLLIVTAVIVALCLLVTYRSPVLWLVPLLNAGIALQVSNAVAYLLAKHAGMLVVPSAASILTVLVFGVGTDYAMLLLARYREELRTHEDRHAAMAVALRRCAPAIAASAATVSLGLLCLLTAHMGFNHALGPVGAIGVIGGLVTMLTLMPALLVIVGRWVFWPRVPHFGVSASAEPSPTSLWARVAARVAQRPRTIWIASALILAALATGTLGMHTGLDNRHMMTSTPRSAIGLDMLEAHYPAGSDQPARVIAPASSAERLASTLRSVPGVANVQPPQLSTDGKLVKLNAILSSPSDSSAASRTIDRIRTATSAIPDAVTGGSTANELDKSRAQSHDRKVVIPLVLAVVFIVLVGLLRALTAPLLLIGTVILSYFGALGASRVIFTHVFGFPSVDIQLVLIGFLFLVALGVDYNIFLVSRIREETTKHGHHEGVLRGLSATGGVISAAGAVLAATFGALTVLPLTFLVQIGFLVALGVLLDTFLVRSILVPTLALDMGDRFWWPKRPVQTTRSPAFQTAATWGTPGR
ncbi:MMPL family transporter [Actinomadura barringtoniae]|uniref:MMPL family transporter n=1 Tax=Actinomadura barringtoniae TaxID=1427535 RepID=A0A939T680_9ACTN|nr:MMPL family transporter [Actinomadura barringtoniae]MBO2450504.1 MMPL family transporter [Actinomadura barringtoniae]